MPLSNEDEESIDKIVANINSKNCILFLGAGVHCTCDKNPALYRKEDSPPMASELSDAFSQTTALRNFWEKYPGEKNDMNLARVSQIYEIFGLNDRISLETFLNGQLVNKKPSPILKTLAELPFEYVISTNYDKLFEDALALRRKEPHVIVYQQDRTKGGVLYKHSDGTDPEPMYDLKKIKISEINPLFFKIHGDIEVQNSTVITEEDYIQFILRMRDEQDKNPIPEEITDRFGTKSFLFIGYSLRDYNLRLLLKATRWGKDPTKLPHSFNVDPRPDPLIRQVFTDNYRVNFLISDAWEIVPILYEKITGNEFPLN